MGSNWTPGEIVEATIYLFQQGWPAFLAIVGFVWGILFLRRPPWSKDKG